MNRLKSLLALPLLFSCTVMGADPALPGAAGNPMALTLEQAVDLALAPDGAARIRLANEYERQADAQRRMARSALLPNVESRVDYQNFTRNLEAFGLGSAVMPVPIPRTAGPFTVLDVRATVQQTVFDFSAIRGYQASRAEAAAAAAESGHVREQTIEDVARAYLAGLRAQAFVEAARANLELGERLLALARSQKRAGTGTGIEATRAETVLANDRQSLAVAEAQHRITLLTLQRLMGVGLDLQLMLVSRMDYRPVDYVDIDEALESARRLRLDLKAQHRRLESARLAYSASRWSRLPGIRAYGDYGSIGRPDLGMLPVRTIGIQAQIPLWDGGRREAQKAESEARLRREEILEQDLLDQMELEIRAAVEQLQSSGVQVQAAEEGLKLAEAELEQAQRRYRGGVATTLEVTGAQAHLQRARANRIEALFNHNLARLEFAASAGRAGEIVR
jgi:outer membrane protein